MFRKAKPQKEAAPAKARRKLTPAEKREIKKIMEAARGDGKPHSAQDTLPFRQIYPDGLCKLDEKSWSRCVEFEDVNYQLAQLDGQTAIFEALCDMYNAHDASIGMELSLVCRKVNREDFRKRIEIAAQGDKFDGVRALYTDMLRRQLEHGNNGMVKTKFLVLTIEADNIKTARARFSRIVLDALNHFKAMGALAKELDGKEWLEVLHGVLHPDGDRFRFEWDWLAPSGLHVKDFICPSSFRFGESRRFQMGGKFGAVSFLQITAPEMNDRLLADLLDTDSTILVSLHIRSMDQNEAIKTVKRKITDLDSMKIDAQKRAAREGFDMDILPSDLATYAGEAKNILRDLQSRNERMFLMTFLVVNIADTKQKLDNDVFRASSVAQKYNCQLTRLDFQQEQGLVSALPLGVNQIRIQRGLTTSSVSIFVPFISQELFQSGEALYYGLNATSGNMILADRKQLKTPNGLILGTPGSGKSFSAKREILNVFLVTKDDIIICDPEAEYFPLVHRLGGQVIKISPTSSQYVNPMDMSLNYSEDDNPLALKSDFIQFDDSWGKIWGTLARTIMGSQYGIPFTVYDYVIGAYTPWQATALSFLLSWSCCVWLGLVTYFFNSISNSYVGTFIAAGFILMDITVANEWLPWFYKISPVTLSQLQALKGNESLYRVTLEYALWFFGISIVCLLVGCVITPKIQSIRRKRK